jgi:hypothetical protein
MHQEARRFGHVEHTNAHDGGEDQRATKNVSPVTRDLKGISD